MSGCDCDEPWGNHESHCAIYVPMTASPCRCVAVEPGYIDATACRADEHRDFTGRSLSPDSTPSGERVQS